MNWWKENKKHFSSDVLKSIFIEAISVLLTLLPKKHLKSLHVTPTINFQWDFPITLHWTPFPVIATVATTFPRTFFRIFLLTSLTLKFKWNRQVKTFPNWGSWAKVSSSLQSSSVLKQWIDVVTLSVSFFRVRPVKKRRDEKTYAANFPAPSTWMWRENLFFSYHFR